MASKNKFICPDCGSPVYGWVEEVIEHRAAVDPKTGRFKKAKKVSVGNMTCNAGFSCTNSECEWSSHHSDEIPDHFLEGLSGQGFEALAESVG